MKEVIVGVDRSDTARKAAGKAVSVAHALGADVHFVMAETPGVSHDLVYGSDTFHVDWLNDATQFLETLKLDLGAKGSTHCIGVNGAAALICQEAERLEASMVVIGNRRMKGAGRILGAVASGVAHRAPCDVLIVDTAA